MKHLFCLSMLSLSMMTLSSLNAQVSEVTNVNRVLSSDGIEMTVCTDKPYYKIDEPIMLEITVANKGNEDRYVQRPGRYDIDDVYEISVLTPSFTEKDLPYSVSGYLKELVLAEGKPSPIARTDFGNSLEHPQDKVNMCLHPNAKLIERMPLGLIFNLPICRMGDHYTVVVKHKALSLETRVFFKMKQGHVSSTYLSALQFSSMFGQERTIRMLCEEAGKLIGELGDADGTTPLTASEHERLTTCLNLLRQLHQGHDNIVYSTSMIWTLDEGRKLLDICKCYP